MKVEKAFSPDFDNRKLFHTARAAREAEFEYLMVDIANHVGTRLALREHLSGLAFDLKSGVYPSAVDAFLKAAKYLETYRWVLTGAENDPDERS